MEICFKVEETNTSGLTREKSPDNTKNFWKSIKNIGVPCKMNQRCSLNLMHLITEIGRWQLQQPDTAPINTVQKHQQYKRLNIPSWSAHTHTVSTHKEQNYKHGNDE